MTEPKIIQITLKRISKYGFANNITMIVYGFALTTALFYMMNIPVGLLLALERTGRIVIGFGAFDSHSAYKFETNLEKLIKGFFKSRKRGRRMSAKTLWRYLTVKRLTVEVGLGDACSTALAAGAFGCVVSVIAPKVGRVTPLFQANEPSLLVECIITLRLGHAVIAALNMAAGAIKERIISGSARTN